MKSIAMKNLFVLLLLPFYSNTQVTLELKAIPARPALFNEGIITTPLNERDMAISPNGDELFYTIRVQASGFQTIVYLQKDKEGRWSAPEVASFSGNYNDLEPAFSPDGKKLFFTSNRPLTGDKAKDFDIWVTEKVNGQWSAPQNPGSPVNTPADEFYPSVAANGNLYYTAAYNYGIGLEDIYLSKWENGRYAEPVALDTGVNSKRYEFNAFVSPDEQYILFTSYGRKDDKGRGDLYISKKDAGGRWQSAKNIALINSDKLDYCPFVSFDKKILFFTSERHNQPASFPAKPVTFSQLKNIPSTVLNGSSNIYWVSFDEVLKSL